MPARSLSGIVCIALFAIVLTGGPSGESARAQDDATTSTSQPPESPGIIPDPASGSEPQEPGDRGGALQTAVFVLIILGVAVIGALIVRDSRRARAERGF